MPILLREIFAGYHGQRLPAAGSYRRFLTWLADRDLDAAHAAWREVLAGFDTPTLVGPPDRLGIGPRGATSFRVPADTTRALGELARSCHTTVNIVLQGAWAQLLMWLTGHHDVAFGATVSGRPAEVPGAESMVGLFINTVPVRATHHAGNHHRGPAGPAAGRPQPHARAPAPGAGRDPPHHRPGTAVRHAVRLRELSRSTPARCSGDGEFAITEFTSREYDPLPARRAGLAGPRTGPSRRVSHRRVRRGRHRDADRAVADGAGGDDGRSGAAGCRRWICSTPVSVPGWTSWGNRAVLTRPGAAGGVDSGGVRRPGRAHPGGGGADASRVRR